MQSCQAPSVYVQPQPQYTYPGFQPTRQPTWWGTPPLQMSAPGYAYQQPMGNNISGRARLSNANRYIPNPTAYPANDPVKNTSTSQQSTQPDLQQPPAQNKEVPQNTMNGSTAPQQSHGNPTNQTRGKEDKNCNDARPKDPSFLHPTGPTNHMTTKF